MITLRTLAFTATLALTIGATAARADLRPEPAHHGEAGHGEGHDAGHGEHGAAAHGDAHGEHGGEHANPKARPQAPEDAHWWIGQEILPISLRDKVAGMIGPSFIDKDPATKLNVGHIFMGLLVFVIGIGLALAARRKVKGSVLPPKSFGAAAFFDIVMEGLMGLMTSMMPREKAVRFLPIVTSAAVFILLSNLLGLLPGFVPPTQSLNTTLALGVTAFIYFTYQGIRAQGIIGFFKHFMGPMLALAPLMFVVELIAYCVRPVSLALRLMGNMFGDHQVLFIFMSFGLPLVPLPLMALGIMVCVVQTVVFSLLFIVYLSLAVEEHDHGDHAEGHGHGEPAHAH
ncbi:MAG: F0F1 ATP synthase subunit A [Deltaproteobacteria bacterium]|nr:F0F1 ATP synthase subunit A [Deltaproteobacteria bacterium]